MKNLHTITILFCFVIAATLFLIPNDQQQMVEAKKLKKKTLIPLLIGVLLASKEKFKPLPLPIPIPLPIKDEKVIPYPEPYHYPVYVDNGYGGGGGGYGHGGGGGGGDYAAAGSNNIAQYAMPPPAPAAAPQFRPY